ncbi:DEAD/DEAH box helicase family protein [Streptomyces sp. NPDC019507]|uniref:DEAD/DEAH box helicase family protein n=1 Tax=Streptomyces sp. NPDC019507 TaxID=3154689 RepID=UPI0033F9213B
MAVERAVRQLRTAGSRGLLVAATGTGKTLISVRGADGLGARLVLFVVPTLDLAAQTALAWRRERPRGAHGDRVLDGRLGPGGPGCRAGRFHK